MKLQNTLLIALAGMLLASSDSHAVEFGIDLLQNSTDPVETDYTGFLVGNKAAGSVAPSITVFGVTATVAAGNKIACLTTPAEFTQWNARNRSPRMADSGAFTHSELYANRIATTADATNVATGEGVGIYVKLDGLEANKAYVILASGNDYNATPALKNGSFYLWDATNEVTVDGVTSGLVAKDNYTVSGNPTTIVNNDVYSASGEITTNGTGSLIFKVTGNIDKNTLNGFYVTQVPDGISPPINLVGTTNGAQVDLDWSDDLSGTLDYYSVYRSTDQGGPYTQVATNVLTSNYTDTAVATGTTYYYVVTATDTGAVETGYSDEISILVRIQPPTGLTRTQGNNVINLDWDDNTSGVLDFYTVYRSETSGGPYTEIATNLNTSDYSDTTVINGTTYYYVVTATDDVVALESLNSAQISGTPFTPITGSTLYAHLDGSVSASVTADENAIVSLWADQTANSFNATSTGGVGTVLYPSTDQSETGLEGVDFGFTDPGPQKSTLAWFAPEQQGAWLNFKDGSAALPYGGFAVFAVVRPSAILGGSVRDVVMSSIESKFALRYEGGRPRMLLGTSTLLGTAGAAKVGETLVLAVKYDATTGELELWDSGSGNTANTTVPADNFTHTSPIFLGGSLNPDQYMKGFIGEVKVYRGILTPSEFEVQRSALVTKWIGASGGFSAWQLANGTTGGLDEDHDDDGVANGIEYFLGGDSDTTGFTPLPGVINTEGTLSTTWTKAATYGGTYGTDFWVETSTTLAPPWNKETEGGNVTITGDEVKFTFPADMKNFARLVVTGP